MRKITTLVLITLFVFTSFANRGLPSQDLIKSKYYDLFIKKAFVNDKTQLVVQVEIVNKDKVSFDFTFGNLSITVVNGNTNNKEEWRTTSIYALDRSLQRQPGISAILVPANKTALANIVFQNKPGKQAKEVTQGLMVTAFGNLTIRDFSIWPDNNSSAQSSSSNSSSQNSVELSNHNSFSFKLTGTKIESGKLVLMVKIYNKGNDPFEYIPANTSINIYNKKKRKNETWTTHEIHCTNRQYQRQLNHWIVIPAKKAAFAKIIFSGKYGPDASKINSGTILYQSNKQHGSKTMTIPARNL